MEKVKKKTHIKKSQWSNDTFVKLQIMFQFQYSEYCKEKHHASEPPIQL